MSDNLYKAPSANLVDKLEKETPFYVVSGRKFWLLYIITLTLYQLYWFYRHWSDYRRYYEADLWPVPRALFSIFFTHSLFEKIDLKLRQAEPEYNWSPILAASLYVLGLITYNLSGTLSENSIGSPYTDWIFLVTLPLMAWPLYSSQKAANIACGDPKGYSNSRITAANIAWIVVFGALWVFLIIGTVVILNELDG